MDVLKRIKKKAWRRLSATCGAWDSFFHPPNAADFAEGQEESQRERERERERGEYILEKENKDIMEETKRIKCPCFL